jgi:hypothetical protein
MGIDHRILNPGEIRSMDLKEKLIQPADPERYFAAIAALMTSHETEPTTEGSLVN